MPSATCAQALRAFTLLVFAILLTQPFAPIARAEQNLLLNGDLSKGSGPQPDSWRTEAWVNDPSAWTYKWPHPENSGPGELEIISERANDARWMQSLQLSEGWYYISADVRTENVGTSAQGATISVMEDGITSPDIRGTAAWQRVGLYLKVGPSGADVDIALRVGGYGSLNTGRAWFRNPSVVRIAAPPPAATPVFDLKQIRVSEQPAPIGEPFSLVAVLAILAIGAAWGWRLFGLPLTAPVPARAAVKPEPPRNKSQARRQRGKAKR